MTFSASSHNRHEYCSAAAMAAANHTYLKERAKQDKVSWLDLQVFESTQRIVEALNKAIAQARNPLLDRFSSSAYVLLGTNARSVTTFAFDDGSRAISLDRDLIYEIATLIFAMSREAEYGALLGACILYNNITASNTGFPMIREIALKCFEQSPSSFNDIVRSCLYLLVFHEVGHEYIDEFGVHEAFVTATDPSVGTKYRTVCYNPPHGPKYSILLGEDNKERVYTPEPDWIEEFAADLFAVKAALLSVSGGSPSFVDFEKTIHHLALWQFVLWYSYVGNIYRDDPDRSTHPSAHNRVDLMLYHVDSIGVELYGDWRSSALTILQQRYVRLFSPAFTQAHLALGNRAIAIQPLVQITGRQVGEVKILDKPKLIHALQLMMELDLIQKPLEEWAHPLKDLSLQIKYGYDKVLASMAAAIRGMSLRFDEEE